MEDEKWRQELDTPISMTTKDIDLGPDRKCVELDQIYPWQSQTIKRIENNFKYHELKHGQPKRHEIIMNIAKDFAYKIYELCPESREKANAIIKLEEVVMWANASIARNE